MVGGVKLTCLLRRLSRRRFVAHALRLGLFGLASRRHLDRTPRVLLQSDDLRGDDGWREDGWDQQRGGANRVVDTRGSQKNQLVRRANSNVMKMQVRRMLFSRVLLREKNKY